MGIQFGFTTLVTLIELFVPGYLALRLLRVPRSWAACISPAIDVALLSLFGQILAFAGIASSPLLICCGFAVVFVICLVIGRTIGTEVDLPTIPFWAIVLAVLVGATLSYLFYVHLLARYNFMFQLSDANHHYAFIQSLANSGHFSSLGTGYYLEDPSVNPMATAGAFYPAGWHLTCALAMQVTGATAPMAVNASMFVFIGFVYPLAMLSLASALFPNDNRHLVATVLVTLSFVAFPWLLMIFGPIWANAAGFAMLPSASAVFMQLTRKDAKRGERILWLVVFLGIMVGLAVAHPNTVISLGLILIPYIVMRIWQVTSEGRLAGKTVARVLACAGFVAFCALVWVGCYLSPVFSGTVSFVWPSYVGPAQELINILGLTFDFGTSYEYATQWTVAPLVIIGFVALMHDTEHRWVPVSYLMTCAICFVAATTDGPVKQLLAGFWYTDFTRLAAMACIVPVPLAARGALWVLDQIVALVERYNARAKHPTHVGKTTLIVACLFMVATFYPNFIIPGRYQDFDLLMRNETEQQEAEYADFNEAITTFKTGKNFHTPFGDFSDHMYQQWGDEDLLTPEERDFLYEVRDIVGDDVVINDPNDGSYLAYGMCGLRVYHRQFGLLGAGETEAAAAIRQRLSLISEDPSVAAAVEEVGARYVLVLDQAGSAASYLDGRGMYHPEEFTGISGITDETPGFEVVLSRDGMTLYRILGTD